MELRQRVRKQFNFREKCMKSDLLERTLFFELLNSKHYLLLEKDFLSTGVFGIIKFYKR